MSLNEEQIDAFTISVEQELTDPDFTGSEYSYLTIVALQHLDPDARQREYLKVAADLAIMFSGAVVTSAEERQRRERDRIRAEEEAAEARRIERQRERDRLSQRDRDRLVERGLTDDNDNCICGVPGCAFNVRPAVENPATIDWEYATTPEPLVTTNLATFTDSFGGADPIYYSRPIDTNPWERLPAWERQLLDGLPEPL